MVSVQDEKILLPGTEQILLPERTRRKSTKSSVLQFLCFVFVFSLEWCEHDLLLLQTEDFDRTFAKTVFP